MNISLFFINQTFIDKFKIYKKDFYSTDKKDDYYTISSNNETTTYSSKATSEAKSNISVAISFASETFNTSKSLAIYKKKDGSTQHSNRKISLQELNENSKKRNSDNYKTIRNKINLDYYLQLSKQIVDKVDKNIYDLSYLTNLSEDSKNAIMQKMMEHIDKINQFFEIKLGQFANNDYEEIDAKSDFAFLGKKRLGFFERNNFNLNNNNRNNNSKNQKEKNKAEKNKAFLKYSDDNNIDINESDKDNSLKNQKCYEPKGVRYTISKFNSGSSTQSHYEEPQQSAESNYEGFNITDDDIDKDNNDNEVKSSNNKASKKYFKYNTENSNIRNLKYNNLPKASDSKSLMVKKNVNNSKDLINLPYFDYSNTNDFVAQNDNVNSLYCKEFLSLADENSEFFRRIFAKLDLQKKADILREQLDLNGNVYEEDLNKNNSQEKISFNHKKYIYISLILFNLSFKLISY